jgi:hypothetical protein
MAADTRLGAETQIVSAAALLPRPRAFALAFLCGAAYVQYVATYRRMPSLGVSSLDSGRSEERPPFFWARFVA